MNYWLKITASAVYFSMILSLGGLTIGGMDDMEGCPNRDTCAYGSCRSRNPARLRMLDRYRGRRRRIFQSQKDTATNVRGVLSPDYQYTCKKLFPGHFHTEREVQRLLRQSGIKGFQMESPLDRKKTGGSGRGKRASSCCKTNFKYYYPGEIRDVTGKFWVAAQLADFKPRQMQFLLWGTCGAALGRPCGCGGSCQEVQLSRQVLVVDSAFNPPFAFKLLNIPTSCECT